MAKVAKVVGLDLEQVELGTSAKFWKLARAWRKEKTISRAELERRLASEQPGGKAARRKKLTA
ncbi:MAG: hypothetical protein NTW87_15425 [Planctomycetota bacterium]|nr:hypothetical protein [Planctomycetota bacterium]